MYALPTTATKICWRQEVRISVDNCVGAFKTKENKRGARQEEEKKK